MSLIDDLKSRNVVLPVQLKNALIHYNADIGTLEDAQAMFQSISADDQVPDESSYNNLARAYSKRGMGVGACLVPVSNHCHSGDLTGAKGVIKKMEEAKIKQAKPIISYNYLLQVCCSQAIVMRTAHCVRRAIL